MIKIYRNSSKSTLLRNIFNNGNQKYFNELYKKERKQLMMEDIDVTSPAFQHFVRYSASQPWTRIGMIGLSAWLFYFQIYSGLLPDIVLPGYLAAIYLLGRDVKTIVNLKMLPRVVAVSGDKKQCTVQSFKNGEQSKITINPASDFRIAGELTSQNRVLKRRGMAIIYLKNSPYICHREFATQLLKLSLQK